MRKSTEIVEIKSFVFREFTYSSLDIRITQYHYDILLFYNCTEHTDFRRLRVQSLSVQARAVKTRMMIFFFFLRYSFSIIQ